MTEEIGSAVFKGITGVEVKGEYRLGTNDRDTLQACIVNDDYGLAKIVDVGPGIAVDLGAHIGGCTLALAAMGYFVHAVEALPHNAEILQRNVDLNGFQDRVKVYHAGIARQNNVPITLRFGGDKSASGIMHRFMSSTVNTDAPSSRESMTIPSVSLAHIFKTIDHCRIIKTDCEGAEWEAFSELQPQLLDRVDWIAAELHNDTLEHFLQLLYGKFEELQEEAPFGHYWLKRKA